LVVPAKFLGIAFVVAGLLLRRQFTRARTRGYIGPSYRRVHRASEPGKFLLAIGTQALGALVCFIGAYFCLTGSFFHEF